MKPLPWSNGRIRTITDRELAERYEAGGVTLRQLGAEAGITGSRVRQIIQGEWRRRRNPDSHSLEAMGFNTSACHALEYNGFTKDSTFDEIRAGAGWLMTPGFGYKTACNIRDVMGGWDVPWMRTWKTFLNEKIRLTKARTGPHLPERPRRPAITVRDEDGWVVWVGYAPHWDPETGLPITKSDK